MYLRVFNLFINMESSNPNSRNWLAAKQISFFLLCEQAYRFSASLAIRYCHLS